MHSHKQTNLFTLPPSPCRPYTQPHIPCLAALHPPLDHKSSKYTNTARVLRERAKYVNRGDCKTFQRDGKKHFIMLTGFCSKKVNVHLSIYLIIINKLLIKLSWRQIVHQRPGTGPFALLNLSRFLKFSMRCLSAYLKTLKSLPLSVASGVWWDMRRVCLICLMLLV